MDRLVSVVVPIYNVEKYLDRCVESIVNQTYKNLEIILVDDGSPDDCPAMCDEWAKKDSRIKVVHKTNAGLGMARNTGIDNATGEYIFFIDSDDYIDFDTVKKCVQNATNNHSDVVIFSRYNVYEDAKTTKCSINTSDFVFKGDAIRNHLLPCMFTYEMGFGVSACCKMFKLDVIKNHNLKFVSEREIISEDSFFTLELFSKVTTVTIIPESFYYYYQRSNSLSRSYNPQRQKQNDIFLQKMVEYATKAELSNKVCVAVKARYHGFTLGTLMQIVKSDLSAKEKSEELKKIYKNELLTQTLTNDVLKLDHPFPRIFWSLLKAKCYFLCTILLFIKAK